MVRFLLNFKESEPWYLNKLPSSPKIEKYLDHSHSHHQQNVINWHKNILVSRSICYLI